ncbi:MAG: polysaccharide pyruvyl transferase family protein [Sarcina sp.]
MKIGILTFHKAYNYGAVLQAYALQKSFTKVGVDCELIDYMNKKLLETYTIKSLRKTNGIKEKIKWILTNKDKIILGKNFEHFFKYHYNLSNFKYNENNINECEKKYDKIVVGSDQVWNNTLQGNDKNFFLGFMEDNKKKYSYAASFGSKEINLKLEDINSLKGFQKIFVREKNVIPKLKEYGLKAEQVLDPTLLLNKDEWKTLVKDIRCNDKNYILVYKVADTPNLVKFSNELAKNKNKKIVYIDSTYKKYINMKNKKTLSPLEFVSYFINADIVVTSSFHGVAFSINLEKEFYYDLDNRANNNNSRLESLIDNLGIKKRNIGDEISFAKLDYAIISKRLEDERIMSLNNLKIIKGE